MTLAALCAFAFLAGFVDSVAGGGGLIQLPALLVLLPGVPVPTLLGTSKVAGMAGTAVALWRYHDTVGVHWNAALPATLASFTCALLGARAVSLLDPALLRPLILALLVTVLAWTLARPRFGTEHAPRLTPRGERLWGVVVGGALGFYDGFFGPGVGSFLMVAFVALFGFDFLAASVSARLVNLGSNLSALAYFLWTRQVLLAVALPMAAANVAGALLGSHLALRGGVRVVRPVFVVVVSAMLVRVGWEMFRR